MRNNVLVLLNSSSPGIRQGREWVIPYLEHFGVPCDCIDLRWQPLPDDVADYPLIMLAHPSLDEGGRRLGSAGLARLKDAVRAGTGLVSFDPQIRAGWRVSVLQDSKLPGITDMVIAGGDHYITQNHPAGERIGLLNELHLAQVPAGTTLAGSGSQALLVASQSGRGRVLHWASAMWMQTRVLGPLAGMDDLFWRGLVWAARKPFCLRGLPPLMTMRVDDVAGWGGLWGKSPLYWLEDACRLGFKPWLGLFIYNLPGETVNELRPYLQRARRPPSRTPLAGRTATPQIIIFIMKMLFRSERTLTMNLFTFNHQQGKSWSDAEAARGMQAVDDWYAAQAPLPLSPCVVPHWGEIGSSVIEHVHDRWGGDLIVTYHGIDAPLDGSPWLIGGPFRKYETPGSALFDRNERGDRPVYYADFQNFAGRQFFHCFTEVRNDTGYEWAPDNDVEATTQRGLSQIKRALDSMALPTLFTHETDYVYKIRPENWIEIFKGIARGIASYKPLQVTLDDGMRAVRATKTSTFSECLYEPQTGEIQAVFSGQTDVPTSFYVFTEAGREIASQMVEVPVFRKRKVVHHKIN